MRLQYSRGTHCSVLHSGPSSLFLWVSRFRQKCGLLSVADYGDQARQLFRRLGIGPGNSLLGGIAICFIPLPYIFYKVSLRTGPDSVDQEHWPYLSMEERFGIWARMRDTMFRIENMLFVYPDQKVRLPTIGNDVKSVILIVYSRQQWPSARLCLQKDECHKISGLGGRRHILESYVLSTDTRLPQTNGRLARTANILEDHDCIEFNMPSISWFSYLSERLLPHTHL